MADVSLDDLIKQDREKTKQNRPQKKQFPNRPNPRFADRTERPNQQQDDQRPPKQKFIKKQFEDRPRRDFQEDRQDRLPPRPPREERREPVREAETQPRTLKVMGLSPEFTNEDLYKLFAAEGALEKCVIEQDNFGRTLTTAIVKYYSPESARSAIQNLNRHRVMNGVLTVEQYKRVKKHNDSD